MRRKIFASLIAITIIISLGRISSLAQFAPQAVMLIAPQNFQDQELLVTKQVLEQGGVKVTVASTQAVCRGMEGAHVKPDLLLKEVKVEDYDAVIFVGGSGASVYFDDPLALALARQAAAQNKVVAAICIAPVTMARAGLLKGKQATVYPSAQSDLEKAGATYTGALVTVDGKLVTASGPPAAKAFGQAILTQLQK
ncbi:MAG: DJ-1/PfpI family protein [Deltaproteobacteria bacterium]|nr:DJ-1/PfpI family protein [Deltaproteobacteria bacterium]MBW1985652.1 DJ-1/PfpI family protein [Deltaproteobacteria bacterium]MBW2134408.1 DJ-1/PfpI family protein [Deltaproteobacteria bacterium]